MVTGPAERQTFAGVFDRWTTRRPIVHYGTNAGHRRLPFQTWRKVKEAFAPEVVARAIEGARTPVRTCLDPFGGSGTTATACQFLGVNSVSVELNPYLADLIRAKVARYDLTVLGDAAAAVLARALRRRDCDWGRFATLPETFAEPGVKGRWVFDREILRSIGRVLDAVDEVDDEDAKRLFRVLLSGLLVDFSNVVVNGKGRRYRRNWASRRRAGDVIEAFETAVSNALAELSEYAERSGSHQVLVGDARTKLVDAPAVDLAVCSPPYPNSFDYTDIYNIELWVLGYLKSADDNRTLRNQTLASHVQLFRDFPGAPIGSETLDSVVRALNASALWSPWIPRMIGAYFADLLVVMKALRSRLASEAAEVWMVVGDSSYAGVTVPTAGILKELAPTVGFVADVEESSRSLRASPQQGGQPRLPETLLVFRQDPRSRRSANPPPTRRDASIRA